MLERIFSKKIGISPKLAAANIVVVAFAFIWYFIVYMLITGLTDETTQFPSVQTQVVGANIAAIAISAVIGSLVSGRLQKWSSFILKWTFAGVFVSFAPLLLSPPSFEGLIFVSTILGAYFGFGMPATMAYFAGTTRAENRATTGGFTVLAIGLGLFTYLLVAESNINVAFTGTVMLIGVRLVSLLLFRQLKVREEPREEFGRISYLGIMRNRSILLYLVPWIMFNIVDYLTIPSTTNLTDSFRVPLDVQNYVVLLKALEQVLIAVFAVIAGFLADAKGRKRLAILGFASLGIGYASLSFFPIFEGWIFYTIADGIAWGLLDVIFLFTLWGDLARGRNSEKLYVLGALPYLLSNFAFLFMNQTSVFNSVQIFPFASFFLFLAVLPLFYAQETLPAKIIEKRELTIYVEKAQEIAEKYY